MSTPITGVYPCYENQFQINAAASGVEKKMVDIADCETFSVSFDNGVEEWHPFTEKGWVRRLLTSKGVTISVTAKRNVGDAGNDAVAALAWVNGRSAEKDVQWTFPDGTVVLFQADGTMAPRSVGYTAAEEARMMVALGCVAAIQLDEGGSSTYISQREGEQDVTMRNTPAGGSERVVSGLSLIHISEPTRP